MVWDHVEVYWVAETPRKTVKNREKPRKTAKNREKFKNVENCLENMEIVITEVDDPRKIHGNFQVKSVQTMSITDQ